MYPLLSWYSCIYGNGPLLCVCVLLRPSLCAHSYVHFLECSLPVYAHFVVMFLVNLMLSFLNILFFRFLCSHVFKPALKYCLLCAQWYTRRQAFLFYSDTRLSPFPDHRFYSSIKDSLHVHAVSLLEMHTSQMEKRLKTSLSIKKWRELMKDTSLLYRNSWQCVLLSVEP